jgi:hypothetical protein
MVNKESQMFSDKITNCINYKVHNNKQGKENKHILKSRHTTSLKQNAPI